MEITSESLTKVFRAFMLAMMVIVNNYLKEGFGVNQPRNRPEPGWIIESFERIGKPVEPMPVEVVYEGKLLNVREALESNRIKQLELMVAMDSVLSTRPGRSNGISELHAKRARQELNSSTSK